MGLQFRNGEEVSDSIGLLISILVRYPEVGTINFDPKHNVLKFTFILSHRVTEDQIEVFSKEFKECVETFSHIADTVLRDNRLICWEHDEVMLIEVYRDVESLSQDEIAMLISLLYKHFLGILVADENDSFFEYDLDYQEELISNILESIEMGTELPEGKLIAFRDDGKVMVFNK
ncbi:hypothetical protein MFMK1_002172 [Metallumcola ferriviriculae]|uniref:Uncharacterized protein n=1 Tax=Metallumcola ferriviriculae TaxID=3039180 RepID=A0AAU0ULX5_9FIRM|nr:hypothetical protein MFMK1_002172 [Desulfitibacteraceae bacterium MK1]